MGCSIEAIITRDNRKPILIGLELKFLPLSIILVKALPFEQKDSQ